jgi:hypothetical protein
MDFKLNKEAKQVAEIIENGKHLRRLLWGIVLTAPVVAFIWKLADIAAVLK